MAKKNANQATEIPATESPEIVELSAPAESPAVATEAPAAASTTTRFRVSLPHFATLEVGATTRDDAVAEFNRIAGVLSTSHQYSVEPLN